MQWVIKIGGSLFSSKYLPQWLNIISGHSIHKIIIVPGGGPFADLVRDLDKKFNLNLTHAHNMAVLGMQQYAYMMVSMCPKIYLASSVDEIHHFWDEGKVVMWEPFTMVTRDCELEKSWQVTSDSLAAWLANFLSAEKLLYIKSDEKTLSTQSIKHLVKQGCLDAGVIDLLADSNCTAQVLHKSQINQFTQDLEIA